MPDLSSAVDALSILRIRGTHQAIRIDYDGGSQPVYVGYAKPGTENSAAAWTICKLTYDGSDQLTDVTWAGGHIEYIHVWDDRASLTYS